MSKDEVKVCFFAFGTMEQGGGFENYVIDTALGLKEQYPGISVTILTASSRLTERLQDILTLYHFQKHERRNVHREDTRTIRAALRDKVHYIHFDKIRDIRHMLCEYHVVYAKNEILELALLKIMGYRNIPPVIVGVHTPINYPIASSFRAKLHNLLYTGALYRWLLRGIHSLQVNTRDDEAFVRQALGFSNVQVVHHAFNLPPLHTAENHPGLRLLFVGRLTEQKGIDILEGVVALLQKDGSFRDMSLKIAGSGDAAITRRIQELADQSGNIHYLGHVPHASVGELYEWCDVVLVPSRYETLNNVAVEAAMAGKVAVATNIAGPREFILPGATGFLVQPTARAFADEVIYLHGLKQSHPSEFIAIGLRARDKIADEYNPAQIYHQLYRELKVAQKHRLA